METSHHPKFDTPPHMCVPGCSCKSTVVIVVEDNMSESDPLPGGEAFVSIGSIVRPAHHALLHLTTSSNPDQIAKWGLSLTLLFPHAKHFAVCGSGQGAKKLVHALQDLGKIDKSFTVSLENP